MSAEVRPSRSAAGDRAFLTVRALDRSFAMPIAFARSVFEIENLTRAPPAPAHFVGLTSLRNRVVGVVCLARRLEVDARACGLGALAIAIDVGDESFALAVEGIGDFILADAEETPTAPNPLDGANYRGFMSGVVRSGAAFIPVLDPFGIFGVDRRAETYPSTPYDPRRPK